MVLCLLSSMLQISGLQGQALGLASLIVAHRQLWLSQARVPDANKAALLDMPISPGHAYGPAVEEILQRSHWECKVYRQVAALLPPHTSTWGRSNRWRTLQTRTVTRTVPVLTAPLDDLRHCLQGTPAAKGRGNASRGQPTHQHPKRRFQGQRPRQSPQTAPPQVDPFASVEMMHCPLWYSLHHHSA
ncbi:UNVERIFIED_CONTAM: hypothetical protein FKN15_064433 [Acipenser sinensis]